MPEAPKQSTSLPFPVGGIVDGTAHTSQPGNTTHDAKNVLPFDTSESRLRGGRRKGVKKTTTTPLESNEIQLLISADIPNASGDISSGGVAEYSEESSHTPGVPATLLANLSTLSNGTQIDENNLGIGELFGFSGSSMRGRKLNNGNDYIVDPSPTSSPGYEHASAAFGMSVLPGLLSGQSQYRQRPVRVRYGNKCSIKGLTKEEDNNGQPYILVDPSKYEFNQTTLAGEVRDDWSFPADSFLLPSGDGGEDAYEYAYDAGGTATTFYAQDTAFTSYKNLTLLPQHVFDEKPWNSSSDKTFATKMEFTLPSGPSHDFPGGKVTFVNTVADETDDGKLCDPYYNVHMTPNNAQYHTYEPYDLFHDKIGFVFRVGADYELVKNAGSRTDWIYDWYKNSYGTEDTTDTEKPAFAVYLDRTDGNSDGNISDDRPWNLKITTVTVNNGGSFGHRDQIAKVVEYDVPVGDGNYHTLEVRFNKNAVDILLDGILYKHYDDITVTFPSLAATDTAGTNMTDSFGYGGIFHSRVQRIYRRDGTAGSENNLKRSAAYWSSYDWETRADGSGNTVVSTHSDSRKGSNTWKLRSLQWLEASRNASQTRVVMAITGGNVYESDNGNSFTKVGAVQVLDSTPRIADGVSYFQKVYLVDGKNYRIYDPDANAVSDWDATGDITLPGGDGVKGKNGSGSPDGKPRCSIIEVFNARIVMAGKSDEPNNWFMSAIGDPLDWDINESIDLGGAITGSSSSIGESSDHITALVPTTDDRLLIAGANSIHVLTSDPSYPDAQLQSVSKEIGIVGQNAWCYGPNKSVYFMGENGLYNLQPNEFDVAQNNRVSLGKFDSTFTSLNFASNHCRLMYDHTLYGVHIFLTPHTRNSDSLKHFFYDTRSDSFWSMEMPSIIGPTAALDYQDLDPSARKILLGGFDGHVRAFDASAKDDDGTAIESYVWLGPIQISGEREAKLTKLIAVLDEQTEGLGYEIYAADTVEAAKAGTPIVTGEWASGRNGSTRLRVRGSAIFVRRKSESVSTPWALENLTATLAVAGKVRQR